jgi:hypothetical protein
MRIYPDRKKPRDARAQAAEGSMKKPETDPQGMYTGVPLDPYELPVQDADDL